MSDPPSSPTEGEATAPTPHRSPWAQWAWVLSLAFVIPGLPAVGAILGGVALVHVATSGGTRTGAVRAVGAVAVGCIATYLTYLVFASVVAPGVLGRGARAQRADAESKLRALERAVYRHHAETGRFLSGDSGWTPEAPCCVRDPGPCSQDPFHWTQHPVWSRLDFVPPGPRLHQLRYAGPKASPPGSSTSTPTFALWARPGPGCSGSTAVLRGGLSPSGGPKSEKIQWLPRRPAAPSSPDREPHLLP